MASAGVTPDSRPTASETSLVAFGRSGETTNEKAPQPARPPASPPVP